MVFKKFILILFIRTNPRSHRKKNKIFHFSCIARIFSKNAPYSSPFFWVPCMVLGCFASIHYNSIKLCYMKYKYLFSGKNTIFIFMLFFSIATLLFFSIENGSSSTIYYCYRILCPLFIFVLYTNYSVIPSKIAKKLAPYTFLIYCIHFPIIEIFKGFAKKSSFFNSISSFLIFFASLFACLLIGHFLRKNFCWHLFNGFR